MENLKSEISEQKLMMKEVKKAIKYKRLVIELIEKAQKQAEKHLKLSEQKYMAQDYYDFQFKRIEINLSISEKLINYFNKL